MEKLNLVEENGLVSWLCCKRPGGACERYRYINSSICKECKYTATEEATTEEAIEFQMDTELSKIIMAGASRGVKKWLFCSKWGANLYDWGGCSMKGGCCTDILWSMDQGECFGCRDYEHEILDHTGFTVEIDAVGSIIIKKLGEDNFLYTLREGVYSLSVKKRRKIMKGVLEKKKGKNLKLTGDYSSLFGNCPGLFGNGTGLFGDCSGLHGNCSGLCGNCTYLVGDCSGLFGYCTYLVGNCTDLSGFCSDIQGDCTTLFGNCSDLEGDCSDLIGDCSGLSGNLSDIPLEEREEHPYLEDWIK